MKIFGFEKPSLIIRIVIGKNIGFLFGILGFVFVWYFAKDTNWMLCWGVLLWYITFGAIISLFGVFTYHPLLKLPIPWWVRGAFVGAWLNFILVLFTFDAIRDVMVSFMGESNVLTSPFWLIAEGAFIGGVIDFFATRYGGEGMALK